MFSHFEFLGKSGILGDFYNSHLHNPTWAVDYFFMLSGFGVYLSSKRPECTIRGAVNFAVNKVKRIYPLYIFSLLLGCIWMFLVSDGLLKTIAKVGLFGLVDASLLQSLTGTMTFSHSLNGVCWFLSTIFICYMFCPWFLKAVDKLNTNCKRYSLVLLNITILMVLSFLAYYIDSLKLVNGKLNELYYGHPFIRCWYLSLGMAIGCIYQTKKKQVNGWHVFMTLVMALLWNWYHNEFNDLGPIIRLADVVICGIVLYVVSNGNGKVVGFLKSSKMVKLGGMSMYLFLIHYPIRMIIGTLFECNKLFSLSIEIAGLLQVGLIIALTIMTIKIWLLYEPTFFKRYKSLDSR